MIEGIAFALVKTLSVFLFDKYLNTLDIEIEGAPSWYYSKSDNPNNLCIYSSINGRSRLNYLKWINQKSMVKEISFLTQKVIYSNMNSISGQKERQIINSFKQDSKLPVFVKMNISYPKIAYEDEVNKMFIQGCISKNVILKYQKTRLQTIVKNVSLYHSNSNFEELDGDFNDENFNELDSF